MDSLQCQGGAFRSRSPHDKSQDNLLRRYLQVGAWHLDFARRRAHAIHEEHVGGLDVLTACGDAGGGAQHDGEWQGLCRAHGARGAVGGSSSGQRCANDASRGLYGQVRRPRYGCPPLASRVYFEPAHIAELNLYLSKLAQEMPCGVRLCVLDDMLISCLCLDQIGQIHLREVPDIAAAKAALEANFEKLTQLAHDIQPRLLARGLLPASSPPP